MPWYLGNTGFIGSSFGGWLRWGIVPLLVWSLAWKGTALWHAARRGEKPWFIVLLVVNTVGILEMLYLLFVAKIFRGVPANKSSVKNRKLTKRR